MKENLRLRFLQRPNLHLEWTKRVCSETCKHSLRTFDICLPFTSIDWQLFKGCCNSQSSVPCSLFRQNFSWLLNSSNAPVPKWKCRLSLDSTICGYFHLCALVAVASGVGGWTGVSKYVMGRALKSQFKMTTWWAQRLFKPSICLITLRKSYLHLRTNKGTLLPKMICTELFSYGFPNQIQFLFCEVWWGEELIAWTKVFW